MAAILSKYPLRSAQEHIPMCDKHNINIDITCEDCDEFICSQCTKTVHKDHDWKTISTAGSLKRRKLKKTLCKIKEENVKDMDEKTKMATKQMKDNQKCCDFDIVKLQKHYDAIVSKLNEIKKNIESNLRKNMERKNAEVRTKKSNLEKKIKKLMNLVKFLEDKHSTMSDYSLIDNLRDLSKIVPNTDSDVEKGDHSVRYKTGDINEGLPKSLVGQTFGNITVTETELFQYGDTKKISTLEAIDEEICYVRSSKSKININVNNVCVTDNSDVYASDNENNSVVHLSPSGSVSTVLSTYTLTPGGICQSTEGLLVTLKDTESELFQLDSHGRRLVRHVTLTGDVIRENKYQVNGQTRLFVASLRVRQNSNTDICVVNMTSQSTGELFILSFSGFLKSLYHGKKLITNFIPTDVVCDTHCNIIVTDCPNGQIHLLSPNGESMKYLLTENEVTNPYSISLYKSTLWVGDEHERVKVFQYKTL